MCARLAFMFWLLAAGLTPALAEPEPNRTYCTLTSGPTRAVTTIIDAETLGLDDGSEVRLIGALAPRPPDSSLDVTFWPPEREARAALERFALGRSVTLAFAGRRTERYGRTLAHVFVEPDASTPGAERQWLQAQMLAQGHARAYVLKDSIGCLRELSAHEAIARSAGIGLWSNAAYQPRDATRTADLTRLRSSFQIVEGEVTSVIVGRAILVLRFSRDAEVPSNPAEIDDVRPNSRGFSIAVKPAIVRSWAQQGLTLDTLKGKWLRIHGWIERRGGPSIEILDPHQIELVEAAPVAVNTSASSMETPEAAPARRRSRKSRNAALASPAPN
jgi:micrococcal nuclease